MPSLHPLVHCHATALSRCSWPPRPARRFGRRRDGIVACYIAAVLERQLMSARSPRQAGFVPSTRGRPRAIAQAPDSDTALRGVTRVESAGPAAPSAGATVPVASLRSGDRPRGGFRPRVPPSVAHRRPRWPHFSPPTGTHQTPGPKNVPLELRRTFRSTRQSRRQSSGAGRPCAGRGLFVSKLGRTRSTSSIPTSFAAAFVGYRYGDCAIAALTHLSRATTAPDDTVPRDQPEL